MSASLRRIDPEDEAQLLRSIEKWIERDVKPVVKAHDHADLYPNEIV